MDSGNKRPARRPAPAKRRPRGKSSPLPLIAVALATLLIVALAIIIPRCASGGGDRAVPAWSETGTAPAQTLAAPTPDVSGAQTDPAQDAQADPTAQIDPTQDAQTDPGQDVQTAPTAQVVQLSVEENNGVVPAPIPTPEGEGYLPVFSKGETTQKVIAITVDDCNQTENLRQIVQCAIDNGGKLTILPIGQNLERESLREVIRYAYENGMELENHTYTHPAFYRMTTEEMAWEIYMNNRAVSETLGVDYQMHFMRTRGGDNRHDLRTHQYMEKMGYYGMAHWTLSGSSSSVEALKSQLAPGNIYLFHTTDNDLGKLLGFIPYATQQGYRLVTLNEMFGLPENETAPLSEINMPEPDPYVIPEYKLLDKKHSYVYDVYLLQQRLIELGWLDGTADGVYGDDTYMAVGYFQKAIGMQPNGNATPETQEALYKDDAPRSNDGRTAIGAPASTSAPTTATATAPVHTTAPREAVPTVAVDMTLFD